MKVLILGKCAFYGTSKKPKLYITNTIINETDTMLNIKWKTYIPKKDLEQFGECEIPKSALEKKDDRVYMVNVDDEAIKNPDDLTNIIDDTDWENRVTIMKSTD